MRGRHLPREPLDIGRVLGPSVKVIVRNVGSWTAIALLAFAPAIAVRIGLAVEFSNGRRGTEGDLPVASLVLYVVLALLGEMLMALLVVHGARDALAGRRVGAWSTVRGGLERVGPAIVAGVLRLLVFGLVAVVGVIGTGCIGMNSEDPAWVTGVFLVFSLGTAALLALAAVRIWLVVPVVVMEEVGPIGAFDRSGLLAEGSRWRVLAVIVVIEAVGWTTRGVLAGLKAAIATHWAYVVYVGLDLVAVMAIGTWSAVAAAVAYHELRRTREGVVTVDVSAVFE